MHSKHTKGPWTVEGPDEFGDYNITPKGTVRCVAAVVSNMRPAEEVAANASLVGAATDMVEGLKEAEAMFRWYGDLHQAKEPPDTEKAIRNYAMADKLAAVIAKAEGRADG